MCVFTWHAESRRIPRTRRQGGFLHLVAAFQKIGMRAVTRYTRMRATFPPGNVFVFRCAANQPREILFLRATRVSRLCPWLFHDRAVFSFCSSLVVKYAPDTGGPTNPWTNRETNFPNVNRRDRFYPRLMARINSLQPESQFSFWRERNCWLIVSGMINRVYVLRIDICYEYVLVIFAYDALMIYIRSKCRCVWVIWLLNDCRGLKMYRMIDETV